MSLPWARLFALASVFLPTLSGGSRLSSQMKHRTSERQGHLPGHGANRLRNPALLRVLVPSMLSCSLFPQQDLY